MGKIKNALYRFMYGRYGSDTLGKVLLWIYLAVVLIFAITSMFFKIFIPKNTVAALILYISYLVLSTVLALSVLLRMFSRNIAKRRRENEKFCGFFKLMKNKFRDRKTHVYRKCPKCRAVLRLPKAKGRHTVVCPRCKNRFEVKG